MLVLCSGKAVAWPGLAKTALLAASLRQMPLAARPCLCHLVLDCSRTLGGALLHRQRLAAARLLPELVDRPQQERNRQLGVDGRSGHTWAACCLLCACCQCWHDWWLAGTGGCPATPCQGSASPCATAPQQALKPLSDLVRSTCTGHAGLWHQPHDSIYWADWGAQCSKPGHPAGCR